MGKIQNNIRKTTLKNLLFVDFFNALRKSDHESINVTEDELEDLSNEYFLKTNSKKSNTDTQLRRIGIDINILDACFYVISREGYDSELVKVLQSYKIEMYPDNILEVCEKISEKLKVLTQKFTTLKAQDIQPKSDMTGEDALAQLSVGLEMKLDFNQVTVLEYISYSKALKEKNQALKKASKKK